MQRRIDELMHALREAIDDALAESPAIAAAMAELEHVGICPSFSVDVALPEDREPATLEIVTFDGPLVLTDGDSLFLKDIGIQTDGILDAAA